MTTSTTTIELPRLPDESAKAFAARQEYVLMGPQRSLEKTRIKLAKSSPGYRRVLQEWSERFGWVESAKRYDDEISYVTVNEAADAYRLDLADYRKRYGDMGKALYSSAAKMLRKINTSLDSPLTELGVGSLITAINAAKTAADLEALALRVEGLLSEPSSE